MVAGIANVVPLVLHVRVREIALIGVLILSDSALSEVVLVLLGSRLVEEHLVGGVGGEINWVVNWRIHRDMATVSLIVVVVVRFVLSFNPRRPGPIETETIVGIVADIPINGTPVSIQCAI